MLIIKFAAVLWYIVCDINGASITTGESTPTTVNKYRRCDYKYFEEADGWFKFHSYPSTWHQARDRCYLEGASLASPTEMVSKPMMYLMETHTAEYIFTGINDLFSTGDFNTLEGIPAEDYSVPHVWAVGEPNNVNNSEGCVKLNRLGQLADVNCELKLPYICYRKKTERDNESRCNTFSPGYHYSRISSSCHKVYSKPVNYSQAYARCFADGGYLAIINSAEESQILRTLISKIAATSPGTYTEFHFVGVHDVDKDGVFRTVKGTTLDEIGFARFDPGEPNNKFGNEHCGSILDSSGRLNDIECNSAIGFVCEIDINESCKDC